MATTLASTPLPDTPPTTRTLADLLEALGGIPPQRVLAEPPPGTATERDVLDADRRGDSLCELVDGVLVEKPMGVRESLLAGLILTCLRNFVDPRNLGLVTGPDGTLRLVPGLVRIPDVAFISWGRVPEGAVPAEAIPSVAPDLAVEVLSEANTPNEMARKRREYFAAGALLVWIVDPKNRTVAVYTGPEEFVTLDATQTLDGGEVLPGFRLELSRLFGDLDRKAPKRS